jgi:hypothetical protein
VASSLSLLAISESQQHHYETLLGSHQMEMQMLKKQLGIFRSHLYGKEFD